MDCSSWGEALEKQQWPIWYTTVPVELLTKAAELCHHVAMMKRLSRGKKDDLLDMANRLESQQKIGFNRTSSDAIGHV